MAMAFSDEGQAMNKNVLVKTIQTMNSHLPTGESTWPNF